MSTDPKPATGLLSRFNRAATYIVSAVAAAGLLLVAGSAYTDQAPESLVAGARQSNSVNYEYAGDRTIRLTGSINKATAVAVIDKMLELSKEDPRADIELRINSPGGVVSDGLAILDVMKSLPNDVRTVCEGEAQSMAAFILSAGTPGKRFAYPNCEIMFHQPSWGETGQITDMQITTAQGNVSKDRLNKILAENSGWPENVIRDLLERNFYPNADEAKQMGFIDQIINDPRPDPAAAPKTQLPNGFCDNPGRRHLHICRP